MEKVKRAWDRRLIRNLLLVLSFVYAVALGLHAASVSSVSAKTKKKETVALEKCNITWDLEKGKTLNSKIVYIDGSTKKIKMKMSKYKVSTTKNGQKKITFTLKFSKLSPKLNQQQIDEIYDKVINNWEMLYSGIFFTLVDYKTGSCLECDNEFGVKMKHGGWNWSNDVYYYPTYEPAADEDYGEPYFYVQDSASVTITVTCPSDYKNLVILAGGNCVIDQSKNIEFYNGEITLAESDLCKSSDSLFCHGLRVG